MNIKVAESRNTSDFFIPGKISIVLDAQAGSSGKGKIGSFVTKFADGAYQFVCNTFMPQASHIVQDYETSEICYKQLNSCAHRHWEFQKLYIGHGAVISLKALLEEIEITGIPRRKIGISPITSIVQDIDKFYEEGKYGFDGKQLSEISDGTIKNGSTCSGVGATRARRVLRDKNILLAKDVPELSDMICDVQREILDRLEQGQSGLLEIAQGYQLSNGLAEFYPNCLSPQSKILMSDGKTKMIKLVKKGDEVVCIDEFGKRHNKKIKNVFKRKRGNDKLFNVVTETSTYHGYDNTWIGGEFTENHEFPTKRGNIKLKDLRSGDVLYNNEYRITETCKQIIIGSLLGDGSICDLTKYKNRSVFSETHSEKQKEYLQFKVDLLKRCIGGKIRKIITRKTSFKPGETNYRYESSTHHNLRKLGLKYGCIGKKKINAKAMVDDMDWRAIAIWFQDDGQLHKSRLNSKNKQYEYLDVRLFTLGFSHEECKELSSALKEKFGIVFGVHKNKNYWQLTLNRRHNDLFFKNISPYIHKTLKYKIPTKYRDTNFVFDDQENLFVDTEKILRVVEKHVTRRDRNYVYDIEVEDFHNFFVGNDKGFINVHNCTSRNCTVSAGLDDMMLPTSVVGNVLLNLRTFPIRIASKKFIDKKSGKHLTWDEVQSGNFDYEEVKSYSGDGYEDQKEITWEQIIKDSGAKIPESAILTSLTKLPRRVFTFSKTNLIDAIRFNQTVNNVYLSLNFVNWVDGEMEGKADFVSPKVQDFINENLAGIISRFTNVKLRYLGTGKYTEDTVVLK